MSTDTAERPVAQSQWQKVAVVKRDEIPAIHSVTHDGETHNLGEVRIFKKHDALAKFVPDVAHLSMSWTRLKPNEELIPHQHTTPSMIIVCEGSGQVTGDVTQTIEAGDTIAVPPHCAHGFIGGAKGLHALSVQFGSEGALYENLDAPLVNFLQPFSETYTLKDLQAHNLKRLEEFKQRPIFKLLKDGTLENEHKRQVYNDSFEIWVLRNQLLLFTRQATCLDPEFETLFLQHYREETHHDEMYNNRSEKKISDDPVIEAMAAWFTHQMYLVDNAAKAAIIFLVIEHASDFYHQQAKPALAKYINEEYFEVHKADCEHSRMADEVLKDLSAKTYLKLRDHIDRAWDMIITMIDRVAELTNKA